MPRMAEVVGTSTNLADSSTTAGRGGEAGGVGPDITGASDKLGCGLKRHGGFCIRRLLEALSSVSRWLHHRRFHARGTYVHRDHFRQVVPGGAGRNQKFDSHRFT